MDTTRLDACGWSSFDVGLFLGEPGRRTRDEGDRFLRLLTRVRAGRRVLELCCGAGALGIALARAGYEVTGVDLDARILRTYAERLMAGEPAVRDRVTLVQADVCALDLGTRYDFVLMEDDSFVYLLSVEDQLACLRRVREHLTDDGLFFLKFETPARELATGEGYEYDPVRQIKTVPCEWVSVAPEGGQTRVRQGVERRRLTYSCELDLLLSTAGLQVVERWGDLEGSPFVDPSRQEYCYLARKATDEG